MKSLEQLKKKELIKLITEIRPKADAYDRVCEQLGIKDNIIGFVKNLEIQCVGNHRELLIDFLMEVDEVYGMHIREDAEKCADRYLKSINSL